MNLAGSEKQIKWASDIIKGLQDRYPNEKWPSIAASDFWISVHRQDLGPEEIRNEALRLRQNPNYIVNSFSARTPRVDHTDVKTAIESINWNLLAVLDTETTGLAKGAEIVELTIVRMKDRRTLFNSLIQPSNYEQYGKTKATAKAFAINKILPSQLKDAPTLTSVWENIVTILSKVQIAAYNAPFDMAMLQRSAFLYNLSMPRLYATDVMAMATAFASSPDYLSLSEACTYLGIDRTQFGDTHRSMVDVLLTIECLSMMRSFFSS